MVTRLSQILPAFGGERSHVRCFLHVVNLIAKAIMRQFDTSKGRPELEEDNEGREEEHESGNEDENEDNDDEDNDNDDNDVVSESVRPVRVMLNKVCCATLSADVSLHSPRFAKFLS
jgi:hypothetical protein